MIHKKKVDVFLDTSTFLSVRAKGLEPPRLTAPDPKSGAATNYATRALLLVSECKGREKNGITKHLSLFYPKR